MSIFNFELNEMNIDPLPLKNFLDRYAHQRRKMLYWLLPN